MNDWTETDTDGYDFIVFDGSIRMNVLKRVKLDMTMNVWLVDFTNKETERRYRLELEVTSHLFSTKMITNLCFSPAAKEAIKVLKMSRLN